MNPWGLYEHQPQLIQACGVGLVAWSARRAGVSSAVTLAALTWALVGALDWLVYAFGHQLARLDAGGIRAWQTTLEWARVPVVLVGAFALYRHVRVVGDRGRAPP